MIVDVMDLLRAVKAWRDSDGNEGFPDEIRTRIEIVLATDAALTPAQRDMLDRQPGRLAEVRDRLASARQNAVTAPEREKSPESVSRIDARELEAILARAEAADPGPWHVGTWGSVLDRPDEDVTGASVAQAVDKPANQCFIAAARTDVPRLVAALREAWRERDVAQAERADAMEAESDIAAERNAARTDLRRALDRQTEAMGDLRSTIKELHAARAERDRLEAALVAKHGGEPVALLAELDAARAESERLRVALDDAENALSQAAVDFASGPQRGDLNSWLEICADAVMKARGSARAALEGK